MPVAKIGYRASDEQRRAGIEQHDVARRARGAIQHVAGNARILRGIGAAQRLRRRFRQADVSRMDIERVDCPVSILRHLRVPGRRDLVEPVSAVHHPGPRGSQHPERARDELGQFRPGHADQLPLGARGIRQRSQKIEGRAHAEIFSRRASVSHRRMEGGREEERDAGLLQAALDHRRRGADVDAKRLEEIGAAASAGHRPVAVFRDPDAAGRDDKRRDGRDVERVRAVAAGATRIEDVRELPRQARRPRAHGTRQPDDLGRTLTLHREADEQTRNLRALRAAFHDLFHRRGRFLDREVLSTLELFEERGEHQISRKLRRSLRPSFVRTDSGWNCTPWMGYWRCLTPMTTPSSVCAASSRSAGSGCEITSE